MESYYQIQGGHKLFGKTYVQGSKNEILPLMAASVLMDGVVEFTNVPVIKDVYSMMELLTKLGAVISFDESNHKLIIDAGNITPQKLCYEDTAKLRCSILLLGSLVSRFGYAALGYPGGCIIGARPIDQHLEGFRRMGVIIEEETDFLTAKTNKLTGCKFTMRVPSVGATQNLILAAVLAEGTTMLSNCSCEPEVVALCNYLLTCGAKIKNIGTRTLTITGLGKQKLSPKNWRVGPDRIAAATYLFGACVTGGEVTVLGVDPWALTCPISVWMQLGCKVKCLNNGLILSAPQKLRAIDYVVTSPFPGFPTDLQSMLLVCCAVSRGDSVLEETIFENRFCLVDEMEKCGAHLKKLGCRVMITGVDRLRGASLYAMDLRSGAALILCGLMAEGESRVYGVDYILRGYEDLHDRFNALGAHISFCQK